MLPLAEALPLVPQFPMKKVRLYEFVIDVGRKAVLRTDIALVAVEWCPTHLLLCRIVTNNRIRHPLNLRQQIRHPILAKHRRNAHAIGVVEKACHQKGIALVVDECDPMNESYC